MAAGITNVSSADCVQFENVLSEENWQRISNLVHMVQSLSDVEKLVLYMKLPVGTPTIAHYNISNSSLDNQFSTSGAVHLSNQLEQGQAYTWIMSHLEEDSSTCLRKDEVYDDYKFYCESHGLKTLNTADFGKIMKRAFPNVKPRRLGQRGQSKYCYGGLRKNIELQPPSLPNISSDKLINDFKENGECLSIISSDFKDECTQIILEWADRMLGGQLSTLRCLAEHLVNNKYVNCRSKAAITLLTAMHSNRSNYKMCDDATQLFTDNYSHIQHKPLQDADVRLQSGSFDDVHEHRSSDASFSRTPQRSVIVKSEQLSPQQLFPHQQSYLSPQYQCETRTSYLGSQHGGVQPKIRRSPFGILTKPHLLQLPHHITKEAFRGQPSSPASPKHTASLHGGTPLTPTGVLHHSQNNQQMALPCMWPPSYSSAAQHQHHSTPPSAHVEQQSLLPPLHYLGPVPLPPPLAVTTSPYTPLSSKRAPPGQYDESLVTTSSNMGSASPAKRLRVGSCFEQENSNKCYERYSLDQPGSGYHTGLLSPRLGEDCSPVQDWMSAVEVQHANSSSLSFFRDLSTSSGRDSPGCQHRAFHSPIHIPNTTNVAGGDVPQFPPVSPTGFLSSLTPNNAAATDLPRIGLSPQPSVALRAARRPSPLRMPGSPCRSSSTSVNPGSPQPLTSPDSPATAAFQLHSLRHAGARSPFAQVPRRVGASQGKENAPSCRNTDFVVTNPAQHRDRVISATLLDSCRNEVEENVVERQRSELNTPTPPALLGVNCSPEFSTLPGLMAGVSSNSN